MSRRKGDDEERFELGGYWLGREKSGGSFYRYWYDTRRGRVRRRTLGTEDFEEAKRLLASIVVTRPRLGQDGDGPPDPRRVLIAAVLDHYLEHRARKLPSAGPAERAVALVSEFLFDVRALPATAKADCFGLDLQETFIHWAANTKGHSAKYISRNLSVVSAALHFAAAENTIEDPDEGRRIVRLMTHAPKVRYDPEWIAGLASIAAPQRRNWVPTIEQMARWIDCTRSEHVFRYVIIALNTWARAETIMELDFRRQIDMEHELVDLNPPGRPQNIKRRPIIRLTENLGAWARHWKTARPLVFKGAPAGDLKRAFQLANYRWILSEGGLDPAEVEALMTKGNEKARQAMVAELEQQGGQRVTRRVIRSFMATRVRSQREVKVDREQREVWLGHQDQDTTSRYEVMDPDYLRECSAATDFVIGRIDLHCRRSLWPEGMQAELPFGRAKRR